MSWVFWIFKSVILNMNFKIPMTSASKYFHNVNSLFKIPMTSPHKYSKPIRSVMNIHNTHDVSFWTFKTPMTSLHDLASWIFKITYNGIFKMNIQIRMTLLQFLNHQVTSWIFWIKKPRCMGILNILYLKLACFVCYLKIKTFRNIMHVS